jgi:hypothetical protein
MPRHEAGRLGGWCCPTNGPLQPPIKLCLLLLVCRAGHSCKGRRQLRAVSSAQGRERL